MERATVSLSDHHYHGHHAGTQAADDEDAGQAWAWFRAQWVLYEEAADPPDEWVKGFEAGRAEQKEPDPKRCDFCGGVLPGDRVCPSRDVGGCGWIPFRS